MYVLPPRIGPYVPLTQTHDNWFSGVKRAKRRSESARKTTLAGSQEREREREREQNRKKEPRDLCHVGTFYSSINIYGHDTNKPNVQI